jgi:hypothetical protein
MRERLMELEAKAPRTPATPARTPANPTRTPVNEAHLSECLEESRTPLEPHGGVFFFLPKNHKGVECVG